jgi:phosphotransferase system enzyme I (PtsP)
MKAQARALSVRSRSGATLNIMFPMVSNPGVSMQPRRSVEAQRGWRPAQSPLEDIATARCSKCRRSPSASTSCCPRSDFLSIGTNDLTQFCSPPTASLPKLALRLRLAERRRFLRSCAR